MPSIKKIHTKSGLSFKITVSCGYDERYRKRGHYKTWKAPEGWSEQRAEREVQKIAYEFENSIKLGFQPGTQSMLLTSRSIPAQSTARLNCTSTCANALSLRLVTLS